MSVSNADLSYGPTMPRASLSAGDYWPDWSWPPAPWPTSPASPYWPTYSPPTPILPYPAQQGWVCPKCGRGVSPTRNTCPCQPDTNTTETIG